MSLTICIYPGCGRGHVSHGLCAGHLYQQKRRVPLRPLDSERPAVCSEPGCGAPAQSRGMCRHHYNARRRRGAICSARGCGTPAQQGGLCGPHWGEARQTVAPVAARIAEYAAQLVRDGWPEREAQLRAEAAYTGGTGGVWLTGPRLPRQAQRAEVAALASSRPGAGYGA